MEPHGYSRESSVQHVSSTVRTVIFILLLVVMAVGYTSHSYASTKCDTSEYTLTGGSVFGENIGAYFFLRCVNDELKVYFFSKSKDIVVYRYGYFQSGTAFTRFEFSRTPEYWLRLGVVAVPSIRTRTGETTLRFYACKREASGWKCGGGVKGSAWNTLRIEMSEAPDASNQPLPVTEDGTTLVFGGNETDFAIIREPIVEHGGKVTLVLGGVLPDDAEVLVQHSTARWVVPITRGGSDESTYAQLPSSIQPGVYEVEVRRKGENSFLGFSDPFVVFDNDIDTQPIVTNVMRTVSEGGVPTYAITGRNFSASDNVIHIGLTIVRARSVNGENLYVSAKDQVLQGRAVNGESVGFDFSNLSTEQTLVVVNEYGSSEPYLVE